MLSRNSTLPSQYAATWLIHWALADSLFEALEREHKDLLGLPEKRIGVVGRFTDYSNLERLCFIITEYGFHAVTGRYIYLPDEQKRKVDMDDLTLSELKQPPIRSDSELTLKVGILKGRIYDCILYRRFVHLFKKSKVIADLTEVGAQMFEIEECTAIRIPLLGLIRVKNEKVLRNACPYIIQRAQGIMECIAKTRQDCLSIFSERLCIFASHPLPWSVRQLFLNPQNKLVAVIDRYDFLREVIRRFIEDDWWT